MEESIWQPSDGLKDLHMYEVIGTGKKSKIHKIRKKRTVGYFALKITDKSERLRLMQEVRALHSLKHRNILRFYMWYETNNHLWTITEYCVGGCLSALLQADKQLPESSLHDFGRDIASALHFLHSNSILHCDLRPANILLDENGCTKLAGFGCSRGLQRIGTDSRHQLESSRESQSYSAPELFAGGVCSFASDLWSLGCILYEMAAGHPPFQGNSPQELVQEILETEPAGLPGKLPS